MRTNGNKAHAYASFFLRDSRNCLTDRYRSFGNNASAAVCVCVMFRGLPMHEHG
jgi:hypothetical protein